MAGKGKKQHYYEVHVRVPGWKTYKFQFMCGKCFNCRDAVIEEVVKRCLLNQRGHLPYITEVRSIPETLYIPNEKMYYETTLSPERYKDLFVDNPQIGAAMVHERVSFKVKGTYAKKEDLIQSGL